MMHGQKNIVIIDVSGQPICPIVRVQESKTNAEDGAERLSRNVGNKLLLLAA